MCPEGPWFRAPPCVELICGFQGPAASAWRAPPSKVFRLRYPAGARRDYPLLLHGIIYDTIPPKMSWGDRGVLRGRSKGFSEALSSFLGSPGNKNRFFRSHSTPRGKAQTKIQTPPPFSSSLLLLLFLAVPMVQFR